MINGEKCLERPIRWAMVGGGRGSQIGYSHRCAALRDKCFDLVAGVFDINAERGKDFGISIGVDPDRCYPDYGTMFSEEAKRPDGIETVSIATPNGTHFSICKAALEAGLNVVCEKPLCFTVEEATILVKLAEKMKRIVGITYGYAGHQMIQQAKKMIDNGELGEIRIVDMQFAHGGNTTANEATSAATKWRVDPKVAGPTYVLGDIGTHPLYISEVMMPNMKIKSLMCTRQSFIKSRAPLEDNAFVIMNYDNGAVGTLWASGVNAGSMHGQKIRVIGSIASIEWWDERPNQLRYEIQGKAAQVLERGTDVLYKEALVDDRIGGGHPEGLFEAWANLYRRFALAMQAINKDDTEFLKDFWYPDIYAGYEGVRWIENCVRSADNGAVWVDYK
ncbi:MAG: putative dehydrogenase [Clostridium sp.]|jgi:predicted dehydrogenase